MDRFAEVANDIAKVNGVASVAQLAEAMAERGCCKKKEVMAVLEGEAAPCVAFVPVLSDVLGLSARVERKLHELVLLEGERAYLALAHTQAQAKRVSVAS